MQCSFVNENWSTIADCHIPINTDIHSLNWIDFLWKYKNGYYKLYRWPFEKILVIVDPFDT